MKARKGAERRASQVGSEEKFHVMLSRASRRGQSVTLEWGRWSWLGVDQLVTDEGALFGALPQRRADEAGRPAACDVADCCLARAAPMHPVLVSAPSNRQTLPGCTHTCCQKVVATLPNSVRQRSPQQPSAVTTLNRFFFFFIFFHHSPLGVLAIRWTSASPAPPRHASSRRLCLPSWPPPCLPSRLASDRANTRVSTPPSPAPPIHTAARKTSRSRPSHTRRRGAEPRHHPRLTPSLSIRSFACEAHRQRAQSESRAPG